MDIEKTQPVITIAGKPYQVHYRLSDLAAIEEKAAAPGRSFMEMAVGNFVEKAAIIWGGLKTKNKGTRNVVDVIELLEKHQEGGGNWSRDVFTPCAAAAMYSGLGGDQHPDNVAAMVRLLRRANGEDATEDEAESGKAVPAAQ